MKAEISEIKSAKTKKDIKHANTRLLKEMADKMNLVSTDTLKDTKKENQALKKQILKLTQANKRLKQILQQKEQGFEKRLKEARKKAQLKTEDTKSKTKTKSVLRTKLRKDESVQALIQ